MIKSLPLVCVIALILLLPVGASADFLGNISITSSPSGANIYVDSVFQGVTLSSGSLIPNLAIGNHMIFLNLSGYQDYSTNVLILGCDTQSVSATLTPATGSISFTSVPSNALVYIDSVYKGLTPVTATGVPYGTRLVLIKYTGYTDWSQNVILNASTLAVSATLTNTTPAVNGSISFTSNPAGSSVYLNNTLEGSTPFTMYNVTPGDYKVLMEQSGYQPFSDTITVTSGTTATEYAKMIAVPTVDTTVAPPAATPTAYTPVPTVKKTTKPTPTPWPSDTPTPASPLGLPVIIGAVSIAVLAMRK